MKRYSLTTKEGTAAAEATLCEIHYTNLTYQKQALSNAWDDVTGDFVDCSDNKMCRCIICGL